MESLGLLHVFASSPVPKVFASTAPLELFADKDSIRQTMIEAHESIIEVSPRNAELFRDVIEQSGGQLEVGGGYAALCVVREPPGEVRPLADRPVGLVLRKHGTSVGGIS